MWPSFHQFQSESPIVLIYEKIKLIRRGYKAITIAICINMMSLQTHMNLYTAAGWLIQPNNRFRWCYCTITWIWSQQFLLLSKYTGTKKSPCESIYKVEQLQCHNNQSVWFLLWQLWHYKKEISTSCTDQSSHLYMPRTLQMSRFSIQ